MTDREQAIADVLMGEGWTCDMHEPDPRCKDCARSYARTAKAILALPDPVHEAARVMLRGWDTDPGWAQDHLGSSMEALRAALSAERVPAHDPQRFGGDSEGKWTDAEERGMTDREQGKWPTDASVDALLEGSLSVSPNDYEMLRDDLRRAMLADPLFAERVPTPITDETSGMERVKAIAHLMQPGGGSETTLACQALILTCLAQQQEIDDMRAALRAALGSEEGKR